MCHIEKIGRLGSEQGLLENPCELGIELPGSITHGNFVLLL